MNSGYPKIRGRPEGGGKGRKKAIRKKKADEGSFDIAGSRV